MPAEEHIDVPIEEPVEEEEESSEPSVWESLPPDDSDFSSEESS